MCDGAVDDFIFVHGLYELNQCIMCDGAVDDFIFVHELYG